MPQTKIQGKFYPLKSEEWLDSINKLTHSELKILYYVRSLDPYSNGVNLTPAQIARDLSTEKHKMHRATVGRALKSLDRKGFINMELLQVRVKVNPKGFLSEDQTSERKNVVATQQCCDHATQVVTTQHKLSPHNTSCDHTTQVVTTQQSKPETQSEHHVENPKTLKTYIDFKRSLSEGERENFFNFVRKKTENLEKPINDLEAWLASKNAAKQNRWEIYYKNYQEEKISQSARNNKQNPGSGNYSPSKMERAIAEFKKQRRINQPVDEPENIDSEEFKQRQAKIRELIENPPEFGAASKKRSPQFAKAERLAKLQAELEQDQREIEERIKNSDEPINFYEEDLKLISELESNQPDQIPELDVDIYRKNQLKNKTEISPEEQEDE